MSVEISEIREGLATNLRTISESRQVSAYRLEAPVPPALLVVGFDEILPTAFGRGGFEIPMLVQGLAGKAMQKSAQVRLDKWLSPTGSLNVWSAIESDRTLGGKVSFVTVLRCEGSQFIRLDNGVEMLGSTWHVQVDL